ncbi:MAG: sporulation protein YabP [Clostridia bacterium]|nr:sporulation protein YabP [Clostridia bacterium]
MEENSRVIQNVIIESRKKLSISGVRQVLSFDDETLLLDTALGRATVKGEDLKIENFNTSSGDLSASGTVHAVVYMASEHTGGGFISRLFR